MNNYRVAIYGAGAMGTVLGAYITRAGRQIDLITRNVAHVTALKNGGAHIVGTVDFTVPVSALTPEEMTGKYDVIFLMTKQRNNDEICRFLSDYLSEDGVVCTLQNGLPEPSVASVIGSERTLGCVVSWGATFIGEGTAELTSAENALAFTLGSGGVACDKVSAVESLLKCMGKVEISTNFLGARWAKLAINSTFSSISAISGLTFGEVAKGKVTRRLALDLLNEAFSAAEACGVKMDEIQGHDIVKLFGHKSGFRRVIALRILPLAIRKHKKLISGMYFDLKAGRKCDIDFINGIIAHGAKNFGVEVPINKKILVIAHKIENGEMQVSPENINLLV